MPQKYTYSNDINELRKMAADIESFAEEHEISPATAYALNLCLDEVFTNIVHYGIKDKPLEEQIHLELHNNNIEATAIIKDRGTPFNPLKDNPKPLDIDSLVEDRPIGGLGVFFLEQYMDNVSYRREDEHNILVLKKRHASEDSGSES